MPSDWRPHCPTQVSQAQKDGDFYTAANGDPIFNEGEKTLWVTSKDSYSKRRMTFQLAKVNKALGSVSQIVQNGNKVVFDGSGSYIEADDTKERMWLTERNGVYVLPLRIAPPGDPSGKKDFTWQGQ